MFGCGTFLRRLLDVLLCLCAGAAAVEAFLRVGVGEEPALGDRGRHHGLEDDDGDEQRELGLVENPGAWVRESARSGAIPCVRLGRYVRFREPDVLACSSYVRGLAAGGFAGSEAVTGVRGCQCGRGQRPCLPELPPRQSRCSWSTSIVFEEDPPSSGRRARISRTSERFRGYGRSCDSAGGGWSCVRGLIRWRFARVADRDGERERRAYPECAGAPSDLPPRGAPRPWALGGRRSCSRRAVLLGARPARVEGGGWCRHRTTPTSRHNESWPRKSNPVRLGSSVSRALARREVAGFRPGFWPQGQLRHPSPLGTQAKLSLLPSAVTRGRVPVWPPADTRAAGRTGAVTHTDVIVGYATSVLFESVRPSASACNGPHDRVTTTRQVALRK